jgi:hypothetical protein
MYSSKPRKLRILCIHGYNHTSATFRLGIEDTWHRTFGDIAEFTYIEGPEIAQDPPLKYLLEKGFKKPFRAWANEKDHYRPQISQDCSNCIDNLRGVYESILFVTKILDA